MKLNRFETLLMNNPVRTFSLRWIEGPMLARWLRLGPNPSILEVGCGRGVGAEAIARRFPGARIAAFDLDPAQIARARRRLGSRTGSKSISLAVADAERLPFPDSTFDAAFEFGILHHVPGWRGAVKEVFRVLRPGAGFAFEDLGSRFSDNRAVRVFFDHPTGLGFGPRTLSAELGAAGFEIAHFWRLGEGVMAGSARKPA